MGQFRGDVKFCWGWTGQQKSGSIDHIEQPVAWQKAKKDFLIYRGGLSLSSFCVQACRYLGYVSCWEHEGREECTCRALETGKNVSSVLLIHIVCMTDSVTQSHLQPYIPSEVSLSKAAFCPLLSLCLCSDLCCFITLSSIVTLGLRFTWQKPRFVCEDRSRIQELLREDCLVAVCESRFLTC